MVSCHSYDGSAHLLERLHDLRLVFAFAKLGRQKMVHRRGPELGIAFFEYLFQVPANRAGYTTLSLPQLKVLREVITLSVFAPFAILYMHQAVKLDYVWAGVCLLGAVYFTFRS